MLKSPRTPELDPFSAPCRGVQTQSPINALNQELGADSLFTGRRVSTSQRLLKYSGMEAELLSG